jgi:transcriptional regulator NrdR family protein
VLETRVAGPHETRGRRECKNCGTRFTTVEQVIGEAGLHLSAEEHARMTTLLDELLPLLKSP